MCVFSDKTDGQRLRYACGHTACDNCIIDAADCQLCLTPPPVPSPQPKLDNALTQRVKNATGLLKVCENLFGTDGMLLLIIYFIFYSYIHSFTCSGINLIFVLVFKHKRLSEQLRIEKELFPECIQAPVKYENKRKSTFISQKNKENSNTTFFPGEDTSFSCENIIMENSARYVQQWLNKNDSDFERKPFRDLNVNTQLDHNTILPVKNYKQQTKNNQNVSVLKTNRKRSHYKTIVKNNSLQSGSMKSIMNQCYGGSKKVKKELHPPNAGIVRNKTKTEWDNDESGIFMDDDPIVIDDSQDTIIDKDRNAWLAVLKANENEENESTSLVNLDSNDHKTYTNKETLLQSDGLQSKTDPNMKVPFYKKSYIIETCTHCNAAPDKVVSQPEKVEITIDNANFTAQITVLKNVENNSKLNTTNSVSVQTDTCASVPIDNIGLKNLKEKDCNEDAASLKSHTQSEDLFEEEEQNIETECKENNLHDCIVIAESDSDMELESSGPLPVKVDVHRSCDES